MRHASGTQQLSCGSPTCTAGAQVWGKQGRPHERMDLRTAATIACILAASVTAATAMTAPADRAALVAIAATNPSFNASGSWSGDPCGDLWRGVTCDSSSRVTTLGLSNNGLTGAIPPELGGLASLTTLGLSNNGLTGAIPPELGGLASLTYLGLYSNGLTGAIPPELGGLPWLTYLGLSSNNLTGAIPPELGGLVRLTSLDLYSNNLTGAIPPELGGLASLMSLDLSSNNLTGAIPPELGGLASLTYLGLYSNGLNGPIPKALGKLKATIELGCIVLSSTDAAFVCTEWGCRATLPCLRDSCNICSFPNPRVTVLLVWIAWCGIGFVVLTSTLVLSRYYLAAPHGNPNSNLDVTLIGIGSYLWGLMSLSMIVFDFVTNFQILGALLGSWSLYVVALLIVLQHVVSGVVLYTRSVHSKAWPIASGLHGHSIKWKWDWRRCIIGFEGDHVLGCDDNGIQGSHMWHVLLWPVGLLYVVLLDILSLLALKVGLQCRAGSDWVNLQPYWASRELSDAFLQALPQAIFQSILLLTRANPASSKIFITRSQFVLSASSSLGSVVLVSATVLWEARAEGEYMLRKMWRQFFGILPRKLEGIK